jgi:hypothetical protein
VEAVDPMVELDLGEDWLHRRLALSIERLAVVGLKHLAHESDNKPDDIFPE